MLPVNIMQAGMHFLVCAATHLQRNQKGNSHQEVAQDFLQGLHCIENMYKYNKCVYIYIYIYMCENIPTLHALCAEFACACFGPPYTVQKSKYASGTCNADITAKKHGFQQR